MRIRKIGLDILRIIGMFQIVTLHFLNWGGSWNH